MSRHNRHIAIDPSASASQLAVLRAVGREFDRVNNNLMERTAEVVLLLSGYLLYRIENMTERLDSNTPFSMRLRNRSNTIIRACDEFVSAFEPYIEGKKKHDDYASMSDVIFGNLDSLFDDMHRDEPEATMQIRRRAKLRYHDPYPEHVKECTEAFEDGYTKGYTDAMADFIKEVAKASDDNDKQLSVGIVDGKITIKTLDQ